MPYNAVRDDRPQMGGALHGNDESWHSFGHETIDEIMRTHASVTESLVASGEFIGSN